MVPDRVIHVDTVADFTEDGVQKQTAGGQTPASAQGSESPLDLSLKSGARVGYCPGETPEEPPIPVLHFSHNIHRSQQSVIQEPHLWRAQVSARRREGHSVRLGPVPKT